MTSCILLAAGESARFGSPKPLARLGPVTVIEFLLKKLLSTVLDEIIVVLGAHAEEISAVVPTDSRIRTITNEKFQMGQTSSFKTGLKAVKLQSAGVMLWPADMPCIRRETVDFLLENFSKNPDRILIPTFKNKNGHPPIFPITLKKEFLDLKDTKPLSTIQHRHADRVLRVSVADEGVVLSFNTSEEFESILGKLKTEN